MMVRVAGSQQSEKEQVLIKALVGDKLVGSFQLLLEPQQKGIVKFDLNTILAASASACSSSDDEQEHV